MSYYLFNDEVFKYHINAANNDKWGTFDQKENHLNFKKEVKTSAFNPNDVIPIQMKYFSNGTPYSDMAALIVEDTNTQSFFGPYKAI